MELFLALITSTDSIAPAAHHDRELSKRNLQHLNCTAGIIEIGSTSLAKYVLHAYMPFQTSKGLATRFNTAGAPVTHNGSASIQEYMWCPFGHLSLLNLPGHRGPALDQSGVRSCSPAAKHQDKTWTTATSDYPYLK